MSEFMPKTRLEKILCGVVTTAKTRLEKAVKYAVEHAGGGGSASNAPLETNCTVSVDEETGKQIITTDLTAAELFSAIEAGKFLAATITIGGHVIRKIMVVDALLEEEFYDFSLTAVARGTDPIYYLAGELSAGDTVVFRQL